MSDSPRDKNLYPSLSNGGKVVGSVKDVLGSNFIFAPVSVALHLVGKEDEKAILVHLEGTCTDKEQQSLALALDDVDAVKNFALNIYELSVKMELALNDGKFTNESEPDSTIN